ncbi:MAG: DUF1289 domain-containing protein [Alphaproteobacteria bacterium]|nr:DUF1289 domain-containing protein [Alphaproteobacteria bacterium]MBU0796327.1 DUF1289 domain-containing protein [Alphaproteobacteria bacterium]MBU0889156.1 DUF1289 domain-containing protein [Alphaproteobacteria bacterium]MBU1812190.1 DUF1289 domain-containing protein [Alphaproteobacteria bacterium]MBU2089733.1 DUF1289 domain-containing protein [Alphaproteobacteria bacterium]
MKHDPADLHTDRLLTMSPCMAVCQLGADGYCAGCRRSAEEIGRWIVYSDEEKNTINRRILKEAQDRKLSAQLKYLMRRFFGA